MSATERLQNRDYTLILDKSGSMSTRDTKNGQSRWKSSQESTLAITEKLNELDPDGITVYAFNDSFKRYDNVTPNKVSDIFSENDPMGGTTLAPVLKDAFNNYLSRKKKGETKANGEILVVVTDGQPSDEAQVAKEIVNFTKHLDNGDGEFGIQFIQVGKDSQAAAFLKRLDDNLTSEGAKYDIVDTKTMEDLGDKSLSEVLLAALDD